MTSKSIRWFRPVVAAVLATACCACQSLTRDVSPWRTRPARTAGPLAAEASVTDLPVTDPLVAENREVAAARPGKVGQEVAPAASEEPVTVRQAAARVRLTDFTADPAATSDHPVEKLPPQDSAVYATTLPLPPAPCPTCPPHASAPAGLPPQAFGGDWLGTDYQRPPIEEYVCNGGDHDLEVVVKRDWSVHGLHPGDTVVHFDTLDGRTLVEASNDVCLYAPRFAAVRKVYGVVAHEQRDQVAGVELPVGLEEQAELGLPTTVVQPLQTGRKHAFTTMQSVREKTRGVGIDNEQRPAVAEENLLPFEDFAIMRRGAFDNTEKARLSQRLLAAVTWTGDQGPQVLFGNLTAIEGIGTNASESVYVYEMPPGKSRLRVVKIASKQNAKPGELVEFTLRFDNTGDQEIGNVTVIDRLHDRLEYVPDTARCTLPADFLTEDEEGVARVLRWEIRDPLAVGKGGLIRFTCRVR